LGPKLLILVCDARLILSRRAGACNTFKEPAGGLWGILNKEELNLKAILSFSENAPQFSVQIRNIWHYFDADDSSRYRAVALQKQKISTEVGNNVKNPGAFYQSQDKINSERERGLQKSLLSCTHALKYYVASV
jgi:hypothetical protein